MDGKCKTMSKKILAIEGFQREKGKKNGNSKSNWKTQG